LTYTRPPDGAGFQPFRRNVQWFTAREAPIAPLLEKLEFTAGKSHWGGALRFGLLAVSAHDFALIGEAMGVAGAALRAA